MMSEARQQLAAWVRELLLLLVSHPEALEVEVGEKGVSTVTVNVRAHLADTRVLIGVGASTHRALAQMVRLMGWQLGLSVYFAKLAEPVVGESESQRRHPKKDAAITILRRVVARALKHEDDLTVESGVPVRFVISPQVPHHVYVRIKESLPVIVKQLGGWSLEVVKGGGEPEPLERQPETADGRFSSEVNK